MKIRLNRLPRAHSVSLLQLWSAVGARYVLRLLARFAPSTPATRTAVIVSQGVLGDTMVQLAKLRWLSHALQARGERLLVIKEHALPSMRLPIRKYLRYGWRSNFSLRLLSQLLNSDDALGIDDLFRANDIDTFFFDRHRYESSWIYRLAVGAALSRQGIAHIVLYERDLRLSATLCTLALSPRDGVTLIANAPASLARGALGLVRPAIFAGSGKHRVMINRQIAYLRNFCRTEIVVCQSDTGTWSYPELEGEPPVHNTHMLQGAFLEQDALLRAWGWEPPAQAMSMMRTNRKQLSFPSVFARRAPYGIIFNGSVTWRRFEPADSPRQYKPKDNTKDLSLASWSYILAAIQGIDTEASRQIAIAVGMASVGVFDNLAAEVMPHDNRRCFIVPPFQQVCDLIEFVKNADYIIVEDTGPSHIGIHTGTPVFVIANRVSNRQERGFFPYPNEFVASDRQHIALLDSTEMRTHDPEAIDQKILKPLKSFLAALPHNR